MGQRAIWFMKDGFLQSTANLPTVVTQWQIAGAVDLFHTGQADLMWENRAAGQRAVWMLQNGTLQSDFYLPTVSTNWHIVDHGMRPDTCRLLSCSFAERRLATLVGDKAFRQRKMGHEACRSRR